jgi:uncharacterized membrane protein YedE/YeeE
MDCPSGSRICGCKRWIVVQLVVVVVALAIGLVAANQRSYPHSRFSVPGAHYCPSIHFGF